MKRFLVVLLGISVFMTAGCATTGRNYDTDINALNSKVAALQGQLQSKDQEIDRLESRMKDESQARQAAENEKRMLSEKLDSAMAQLESSKARMAKRAVDSDLK